MAKHVSKKARKLKLELVLGTLSHHWFEGIFEKKIGEVPLHAHFERAMILLLLNVYARELSGRNLYQKKAREIMGVIDARTARRYLDRAFEAGLLREERSKEDKRYILLYATPLLIRTIESELDKISRLKIT